MTTLVVGASGATGKLLVEQLIDRGEQVRIIVRPEANLPNTVKNNENVSIIRANLFDLSDDEMRQYVKGCRAVASCLGHNLNLKGIYGQPRKLVTDAARRLCNAIKANTPDKPVKYILMNTTGNRNRDLKEKASFGQILVVGLLRLLLPPQVDNEKAADYLRTEIAQNDKYIEWAAVRPDALTDESKVTEYELYPSPTRDPIFDSSNTSRINVSHFMAELITDHETWNKWKGQMPVIYNKD